jgi:tetratricopeptide (TPR) repeat protein
MSLLNLGFAEDALPDLCASLHVEPEQPAVIFSLGKAYLQLRRLSEAEQQFERCLQAEPGHRGARFYLARTWIEQKLFEKGLQALHDLQQAPLSAVEYRDLCFQKARALTLLQRFDQAETCYQELLRLFPCEAVCVNYGNLCLIVHQYAQAVQLFEQALTFNPASAEARRGLALASVQTP